MDPTSNISYFNSKQIPPIIGFCLRVLGLWTGTKIYHETSTAIQSTEGESKEVYLPEPVHNADLEMLPLIITKPSLKKNGKYNVVFFKQV